MVSQKISQKFLCQYLTLSPEQNKTQSSTQHINTMSPTQRYQHINTITDTAASQHETTTRQHSSTLNTTGKIGTVSCT
jgi:hypothetical protein